MLNRIAYYLIKDYHYVYTIVITVVAMYGNNEHSY